MVDLARADAFLHVRQSIDLHQLPILAAQVDPAHVAGRRAILGIELHHHVVQFVVAREGADAPAAEECLQRARDVADGHAQILGPVPVKRHPQLWLVDEQIGLDVRQTLDL